MIFNVDVQLNFCQQIVTHLQGEESAENKLIIVPNDNLERGLRALESDIIVLDRLEQRLEIKAIVEIYKSLDKTHRSINAADAIFQAIKNGKILNSEYFDYANTDYLKSQKQLIDEIFQGKRRIIVAGFFALDEITIHLFNRAIEKNQTIFLQGLNACDNHLLNKFFSGMDYINLSA